MSLSSHSALNVLLERSTALYKGHTLRHAIYMRSSLSRFSSLSALSLVSLSRLCASRLSPRPSRLGHLASLALVSPRLVSLLAPSRLLTSSLPSCPRLLQWRSRQLGLCVDPSPVDATSPASHPVRRVSRLATTCAAAVAPSAARGTASSCARVRSALLDDHLLLVVEAGVVVPDHLHRPRSTLGSARRPRLATTSASACLGCDSSRSSR